MCSMEVLIHEMYVDNIIKYVMYYNDFNQNIDKEYSLFLVRKYVLEITFINKTNSQNKTSKIKK
jgi:hypothetical protein